MPSVAGNNVGLNWGWAVGENGWKAGTDNNYKLLELLTQCNVLDIAAAPPGAPVLGDRILIAATGLSGDYTGHANKLTIWDGAAWIKIAPLEGWGVYVVDEDAIYVSTGSAWVLWDGGSTYTAASVGLTGTPSGTFRWRKSRGKLVTLFIPENIQAVSTSTAFSFAGTNMPTHIRPVRDIAFSIPWLHNNGADVFDCQGVVKTDGVIEFYKAGSTTGFTNGTAKGTSAKPGISVTYPLD